MRLGTMAAIMFAMAVGSAEAQQAYPMRCRGGGDMSIEFIVAQGHLNLIPNLNASRCRRNASLELQCDSEPYNVVMGSRLMLTFSPAGVGANAANPLPGQCAWLDRPVGSDRRFEMHMDLRVPGSSVVRTPRFVGDGRGNFRFDGLNGVSRANDATLAQVKTITDALEAEDYFTVYAYADGAGPLYITAVSLDEAGPQ